MSSLSPELLIGVASIDVEHLALVTALDRLIFDHGYASKSERLSEVLNKLGEQLVRHFDSEEQFFRSCGMPRDDVDAHVQAHNAILEQAVRPQSLVGAVFSIICTGQPRRRSFQIESARREWPNSSHESLCV